MRTVNFVALSGLLALAVACSSSKPPPPGPGPGPGPGSAGPLPPNVRRHADGSCWYYPPVQCPPPPITCEAVPPRPVQGPR